MRPDKVLCCMVSSSRFGFDHVQSKVRANFCSRKSQIETFMHRLCMAVDLPKEILVCIIFLVTFRTFSARRPTIHPY